MTTLNLNINKQIRRDSHPHMLSALTSGFRLFVFSEYHKFPQHRRPHLMKAGFTTIKNRCRPLQTQKAKIRLLRRVGEMAHAGKSRIVNHSEIIKTGFEQYSQFKSVTLRYYTI
jgi:hypothetical protein